MIAKLGDVVHMQSSERVECHRHYCSRRFSMSLNIWAEGCVYTSMHHYLLVLLLQDGRTPLYAASTKGHIHVAELLLNNGANVNLQAEVGSSDILKQPVV